MKRKHLYLFILTLFTILITFIFSGCSTKSVKKIRLNEVTHSVFYAPQYVAINKGFFKQQGLEIELVNGGGSDKTMTAILSNQSDIGLAGPETAIYVYNEGKDDYGLVIGQVTKRDGSFLLARKPDSSFKWSNMEGKTLIGGRKGGLPEMTLEYILRKKGLIPGKNINVLTNIQFDLMAGAFKGGTGDYVTLFEPTATTFEKSKNGYIVASVGEVSGEVPYTSYIAKKSYVAKNKATIQKFINAFYQGQIWVQTHTAEEIANAIKPSFPDSDLSVLTSVAKRYKDTDCWMSDPVMKQDAFNHLQDIIQEADILKSKVPYDKLIDNEFAQNVIKTVK